MAKTTPIPIRDVKIIYLVCALAATSFTLLRIWLRARNAKLWWDDALAFVAAMSTCLEAAAGWMHFDAQDLDSRNTKIAAYYMIALCFYCALWPARLSILYTVIRITPSPSARRVLYYAGAVMVAMWIVLFAQIFWVCVPMPHWRSLPAPQCPLTNQVGILQLVSDILTDGFLIGAPARFFMKTNLETGLKLRLIVIFGASILTTIVSLVHTYYVLKVGGPNVLIAAIVEISVSVIVCNLSVVVTSFSHLCSKRKDLGNDSAFDTGILTTFPAWNPRSRKRPGEGTTFDLTEIMTKKENETACDETGIGSESRTG